MAFGRAEVFQSLNYFAVDVVGQLLGDALSNAFGRTFAAQIVRVWWDKWLEAVAHAEHEERPWFFNVVEALDQKGRRSHFCYPGPFGAEADASLSAQLEAEGFEPIRVVAVNVSKACHVARMNAARAGIDLLGAAFLPSPADPGLKEILEGEADRRELVTLEVRDSGAGKVAATRAAKVARAKFAAHFVDCGGGPQ
ncbi:hypothetical protein [Methylocystis suflitae]|uniref:hypothetical protein n=1 Tax=Methylocystis suflitae TaxID=2951405 RepID=UPI00210EF280|nr:hypothetical protein [Methylocystis suflitae]MCQ4191020.1 hypothetical protein [Methylocystis suflitae]